MAGTDITLKIAEQIKNENILANLSDNELRCKIEECVSEYTGWTLGERVEVARDVFSSMRGYGVLDRLLRDSGITEIMVNGPDAVFAEKRGKTYKTDLRFPSEEKLNDIIQRIVGAAGREVNSANPIVDTRMRDGSRVNAVLPPVSLCGPVLTIRRFPQKALKMDNLIELGSLSVEAADFLSKAVKSKYNIFISGGTGSGKTTFLNALSDLIPEDERIITIEDSAELQIDNIANLVSLETRNANTAGVGEISIRNLIKASLRMRPDRIIVGEVRGAETLDMLQAMNTGHEGSISTGHANSCADILSRLETMVLMGAPGLPLEAIRQQIASALDIIVHLSRFRDGSRKVFEISEVVGMKNGKIELNRLFESTETVDENGRKAFSMKRTENKLLNGEKLKSHGY